MLQEVLSGDLAKALATNSTDTNFPSLIPRATEPTGDGVLTLGPGASTPSVLVMPYALGNDNDTMNVRVTGWRKIGADPLTLLWVPVLLAELGATVSAAVGIAARTILNTERLADTIAVTTQPKFTDADSGGAASRGTLLVSSPTGDLAGFAIVPTQGCEKVQITFKVGGTAPTSMNALYALL